MKYRINWLIVAVAAAIVAGSALASDKPHATRKDDAKKSVAAVSPAPAAEPEAAVAAARWLLGADAISLPFADVVMACTGKSALPLAPGDAGDAAVITKVGAALDNLLPRMNRPESAAHAAAVNDDPDLIAARFENELFAALQTSATSSAPFSNAERAYPAFALRDPANGKTYYLAVTLYPTGETPTGRALSLRPGAAAERIIADGCGLLVGIEHNGKTGRDLAFLNWQLLDLAKMKVRFAPVFQATQQEVRRPGTVVTDGRKGRD